MDNPLSYNSIKTFHEWNENSISTSFGTSKCAHMKKSHCYAMEKKQFRVIKECEIDMRIIGNVNENSFL